MERIYASGNTLTLQIRFKCKMKWQIKWQNKMAKQNGKIKKTPKKKS
jgi:hypothetical protein